MAVKSRRVSATKRELEESAVAIVASDDDNADEGLIDVPAKGFRGLFASNVWY